jgi:polysaccharide pyruvyl transferase WcaK-like protein
MKRIGVCGEINSTNLGDQAIHACLLHLLKRIDPEVETISLDLSGRLEQITAGAQPQRPMSMVNKLSHAVKQYVRLQRLYAGPWKRDLASAQALVIGGGQLLMDDGLNFPLKVAGAAALAQRLSLPVHFSACGAGRSWSGAGRRLFAGALSQSASVTLRDHLSAQRIDQLLPGLQHRVTFDPAIWAADVYPTTPQSDAADFIGLGVMHNDAFNARSTRDRFREAEWMQLWLDLLGALLSTNKPVLLFTTGSASDQQFAASLFAQAKKRGMPRVELASWPANVSTLVHTLQRCSVVVAARLHAAVLSNAYGITTVGMIWDEKVRAYYEEIGQPDHSFELSTLPLADLVRAVQFLHGQPFGTSALDDLRERALENARVILSGGFRGEPG